MSINRISVDRLALPGALLATVKAQARVYHDRDDALMLAHIGAAVGLAERLCNVSLDPAEYAVSADELFSCQALRAVPTRWLLPLNNVRAFVVSDVDAADLSAGFVLWQPDYGGNGSAYLQAVSGATVPWSAGLVLSVGIEDATELSPAFVSLLARMAASMYENREASAELWAGGPADAGSFAAELLAMWRPTA